MVLLWTDSWNGQNLSLAYPELFSFAKDKLITFQKATACPQLIQNFHLPLSIQAHTQLHELESAIIQLQPQDNKDLLYYSWGSSAFSALKANKAPVGHRQMHPMFLWIWNTKCQMKHKFFFWLLLRTD